MKSFQIAVKDWKIRIKDRKSFIMMLFMPILLTVILGASLSGVFSDEETSSMPKVSLAIFIEDNDPNAITFVNDVLRGDSLNDILSITNEKSTKDVRDKVKDETVDVGLVVHKNMTEKLSSNSDNIVSLFKDPTKKLKSDFVKSILTSYIERMKTVQLTAAYVMEKQAVMASTNEAINPNVNHLIEKLQGVASSKNVIIDVKQLGEKHVSSKQYYAAAMLAMFLLYNVSLGAKSFIQERTTNTFSRILSTPTSIQSLLFGKFLGTLAFSFTQYMLFFLCTKYMFSINWGDNALQIVVLGLSYSFAVSGLALLLATITSDIKVVDVTGGIVIQVMALLGGSMLPLYAFPEFLLSLAKFLPNHWALTSLLNVMEGATWSQLYYTLILFFSAGAVSYFVGVAKFTRVEGGLR